MMWRWRLLDALHGVVTNNRALGAGRKLITLNSAPNDTLTSFRSLDSVAS